MERHQLIKVEGVQKELYVEYGAGKAGLSSFVAQRLGELHEKAEAGKGSKVFVVIDRDALRMKKDLHIRNSGFETDRIRIDIADFDLVKYLGLKHESQQPKVIGIAKHLCGGATDLALTSYNKLDGNQLLGLSMATCCHHLCDAKTYVNLNYIRTEFGITDQEFNVMVRCSSWAISPYVSTQKRRAGFKMKRLLDLGRLMYIRDSCAQQVQAVQYCNPATESPECTLLLT